MNKYKLMHIKHINITKHTNKSSYLLLCQSPSPLQGICLVHTLSPTTSPHSRYLFKLKTSYIISYGKRME